MALPVSEDGTLLVSMLSVMTLNMLRENIMGMTVRQNWNTVYILACGGEGTHGQSVAHLLTDTQKLISMPSMPANVLLQ